MSRTSPKTPEETLRGIVMSAAQRAQLIRFMREFPNDKKYFDLKLRPLTWSPTERLGYLAQAKAALTNLRLAMDASFQHDLLDAAKSKREKDQVVKFIKLLPEMADVVRRITEKRVRERWAGADGRSARKARISIATDLVRFEVDRAGFCVYPPDAVGLKVLRAVLSYVAQTSLTISAVRKRIAGDRSRGRSRGGEAHRGRRKIGVVRGRMLFPHRMTHLPARHCSAS
jgi:hypothetical protein